MSFILALLAWLLMGVPTALVFRYYQRTRIGLALIPMSGMLAIAGGLTLAGWIGIPLSRWPLLATLVSLFLSAIALLLLKGAGREKGDLSARNTIAGAFSAIGAAALISLTCVVTGFSLAKGWPAYEWDGFSIWLLRAKVFAGSETFPFALFSEAQITDSHWDYPLLLPALFAWFMRIGGLEMHQLSIVIGILGAVIPAATAVGLTRIMPTAMAVIAGYSPYLVPGLVRYHFGAYADPLLVLFTVAAIAWLTMGIAFNDRAQLAAGTFALTALVATKNEGMLWCLAILAMAFLLTIARSDILRAGTGFIRLAPLPALCFLNWKALCSKAGAKNDLMSDLNYAAIPERFAEVYVAVFQEIVALETLILLMLAVLSIVLFTYGSLATRFRNTLVHLSAPFFYIAGMILIYAGTPHDLDWHLDTSLARTMFGILPSIITIAVCCYAKDIQPVRSRRPIASLANSLY